MAKEMIKDLDVACAILEKDYWDVKGKKTSVLENFDPVLFLYRKDVHKMADAIAKNWRATNKDAEYYTNEQLEKTIEDIKNINDSFEEISAEKALEATKINPKEASIAKIINEIEKD